MTEKENKKRDSAEFAGKVAQRIEESAVSKGDQGIVLSRRVELMTKTKEKDCILPIVCKFL